MQPSMASSGGGKRSLPSDGAKPKRARYSHIDDDHDMVVAVGSMQYTCTRRDLIADPDGYFRSRVTTTRHSYFTTCFVRLGSCRVHWLDLGDMDWADPLDWPLFYTFMNPLTMRTARIDDNNVETLAQWFYHFKMPQLLAECEQLSSALILSKVQQLLNINALSPSEQLGALKACWNFAETTAKYGFAATSEAIRTDLHLTLQRHSQALFAQTLAGNDFAGTLIETNIRMRQQQESHETTVAGLEEKNAALERESRAFSQRNTQLLQTIKGLPNVLFDLLPDTKAVPTGAKNLQGHLLDEFAGRVLYRWLSRSSGLGALVLDPPSWSHCN